MTVSPPPCCVFSAAETQSEQTTAFGGPAKLGSFPPFENLVIVENALLRTLLNDNQEQIDDGDAQRCENMVSSTDDCVPNDGMRALGLGDSFVSRFAADIYAPDGDFYFLRYGPNKYDPRTDFVRTTCIENDGLLPSGFLCNKWTIEPDPTTGQPFPTTENDRATAQLRNNTEHRGYRENLTPWRTSGSSQCRSRSRCVSRLIARS